MTFPYFFVSIPYNNALFNENYSDMVGEKIQTYKSIAKNSVLRFPIEKLRGFNYKIAKPLKNLGISTIHDLLWHIPFRYDDFSNMTSISELKPNEIATIEGVVLAPSLFSTILGLPASITATALFVVPKSIPIIFDIWFLKINL